MKFLSWGDYVIPFDWAIYWAKHFYMWSFQSGTPNPDGVIRLPGRALNFLVFGVTDNVGLGYFYIFASLLVAFLAFFFDSSTSLMETFCFSVVSTGAAAAGPALGRPGILIRI